MILYDWWFSGWRIYDDWVETKRFNFNIRFVWYPSDMLLNGVSFSPHTYHIHLIGFGLHFHWLKKNKKYWGKKERGVK